MIPQFRLLLQLDMNSISGDSCLFLGGLGNGVVVGLGKGLDITLLSVLFETVRYRSM